MRMGLVSKQLLSLRYRFMSPVRTPRPALPDPACRNRSPITTSRLLRQIGFVLAASAFLCRAQALDLSIAHVNPPGEPTYEAFQRMSERLALGSSELRLRMFSRGQIGDEKDSIEQVRLGALTLASVSTASLSSFAPSVGVFDIPFLFRDDHQHPWQVADGPIGREVARRIENESGLVVVGWTSAGMRHVFTRDRPVKTMEDLKGQKIRVIGSRVYIDTFNALGAKPAPMPYGEVYTALATGTIDAAENDTPGYRGMKFYEQAAHLSLTGHFFLFKVVIANKARLAALSAAQRAEFDSALADAISFQRQAFASAFANDLAWFRSERKVQVYTPDRALMAEAVRPVREKYARRFGVELVEAIQQTR